MALLPMGGTSDAQSASVPPSGHVLSCAFLSYWVDVSKSKMFGLGKKKDMKQILSNVSVVFRPGTVTAIMGERYVRSS